jgi:hypothetical protein
VKTQKYECGALLKVKIHNLFYSDNSLIIALTLMEFSAVKGHTGIRVEQKKTKMRNRISYSIKRLTLVVSKLHATLGKHWVLF